MQVQTDTARVRRALFWAAALTAGAVLTGALERFNGWYIAPMACFILIITAGAAFKIRAVGPFRRAAVVLAYLLAAVITVMALEMAHGNNFAVPFDGRGMMRVRALINIAIALVFYVLMYALTGTNRRALTLGAALTGVLGVAAYLVLELRGDILMPSDAAALGTAAQVAGSYRVPLHSNLYAFALALLAIFSVARAFPVVKARGHAAARTVAALCVLLCAYAFEALPFERAYYAWFIPNNGYPFTLAVNAKLLKISPPAGYAPETVARDVLAEKSQKFFPDYDARAAIARDFENGEKPVIICIMNESLADLNTVGPLETDREIYARITALSNAVRGSLYVDVFGGGTADSEFSFLTGDGTFLLPDNARPYQLYVSASTPALPKNLKRQGYATLALHPDQRTNWNRETVYRDFGFDSFEDIQSFAGAETSRDGYVTDRATYQRILRAAATTPQPLFVFDVTMQNHGSYTQSYTNLEPVTILSPAGDYPMAAQYLSLARASDAMFGELTDALENYERPVIVCMFGDHQPKLEDDFYNALAGADKDAWNLRQRQNQQMTPFVIWANYELPENTVDALSVNYLGAMLTELSGTEMSAFQHYLAGLCRELPVINRKGVVTASGQDVYYDDLDKEQAALVNGYKAVIYNNLFDKKNQDSALYTVPVSE